MKSSWFFYVLKGQNIGDKGRWFFNNNLITMRVSNTADIINYVCDNKLIIIKNHILMSKATITINDDFIFTFEKKTAGSVDDIRDIPDYVKKYFIENYENLHLKDEGINKKQLQWPKYIPDLKTDPLYLLEVEMYFYGNSIGGILYRPDFTEDSTISANFVEIVEEDDEKYYMRFKIIGELIWDFKANHLNNYKNHVEKNGSSWEDAKIALKLSFIVNHLYKRALDYDENGNSLPSEPENENNLRFVLGITPIIYSNLRNYKPQKEWEKNLKFWELLIDKNVTFGGNYLKHFN